MKKNWSHCVLFDSCNFLFFFCFHSMLIFSLIFPSFDRISCYVPWKFILILVYTFVQSWLLPQLCLVHISMKKNCGLNESYVKRESWTPSLEYFGKRKSNIRIRKMSNCMNSNVFSIPSFFLSSFPSLVLCQRMHINCMIQCCCVCVLVCLECHIHVCSVQFLSICFCSFAYCSCLCILEWWYCASVVERVVHVYMRGAAYSMHIDEQYV